MKTSKRALTAQIKPETRNAIMDQLALAADRIMGERLKYQAWQADAAARHEGAALRIKALESLRDYWREEARIARRRWWHRLMWWRA